MIRINEELGKMFIASKESDWDFKTVNFSMPYQSGLTNLAIEQITS